MTTLSAGATAGLLVALMVVATSGSRIEEPANARKPTALANEPRQLPPQPTGNAQEMAHAFGR